MINKAEFVTLLEVERKGVAFYSSFYDQLPDSPVRDKIRAIRDDEAKHVRIAERMLAIVENALSGVDKAE